MKKDSLLPERCERLKKLRENAGKSKTDMAKTFGVTDKTYRSWENGEERKINPKDKYSKTVLVFPEPDLKNLIKMAVFFDCSIDYILGRDDCTSVDNQYIFKKTGLCEDSIKILGEHFTTSSYNDAKYNYARNGMKALNDLICDNPYFFIDVLSELGNSVYWKRKYDQIDGATHRNEKNEAFKNWRLSMNNAIENFEHCVNDIYRKNEKTYSAD